jgi:hypothetical protein
MKFDGSFFIGLIVGALLVFILVKVFGKQTSHYDIQDFPASMSAEEAATLLKTQTTDIGTELAQKLNSGMSANASKDDLIKLTWSYADMSNQLNKNYSAYKIRTMNTMTPGSQTQAPAPKS